MAASNLQTRCTNRAARVRVKPARETRAFYSTRRPQDVNLSSSSLSPKPLAPALMTTRWLHHVGDTDVRSGPSGSSSSASNLRPPAPLTDPVVSSRSVDVNRTPNETVSRSTGPGCNLESRRQPCARFNTPQCWSRTPRIVPIRC